MDQVHFQSFLVGMCHQCRRRRSFEGKVDKYFFPHTKQTRMDGLLEIPQMWTSTVQKKYKTEPIPTISYKWCQTINIPERRSTAKFPCCVKDTLVDRRVPWKAVIWGNITETSGNIMENPSLFKKLKIAKDCNNSKNVNFNFPSSRTTA